MTVEQHPSTSGAAYVEACRQIAEQHGASVWLAYVLEPGEAPPLYLVYEEHEHYVLGRSSEAYAGLSPERAAYRAAEAAVDTSCSRCPSCGRFTALTEIADERGPEDEPEARGGLCWFYYSRQRRRFLPSCRPLALVN